MSCENCKHIHGEQGEVLEAPAMVPLYAVESQGFRRERTIRGTVIVFCVALLVISILVGVFGYFAYHLHVQTLEKVEAINKYWLDYLRTDRYGFQLLRQIQCTACLSRETPK